MKQNSEEITLSANGVSQTFGLGDADYVGLMAAWNATVTAGTVTLEVAPSADYAGTWAAAVLSTAYSAGAPITTVTGAAMAYTVGRLRLASLAGASASVTVTVNRHSYSK